jgi:hypothetical protein
MKIVWARELNCKGFELFDWKYRWYGIEFKTWGLGISLKKRVTTKVQEEASYTPPPQSLPGR